MYSDRLALAYYGFAGSADVGLIKDFQNKEKTSSKWRLDSSGFAEAVSVVLPRPTQKLLSKRVSTIR